MAENSKYKHESQFIDMKEKRRTKNSYKHSLQW